MNKTDKEIFGSILLSIGLSGLFIKFLLKFFIANLSLTIICLSVLFITIGMILIFHNQK